MTFESLLNSLPGGIALGLVWGILALGVYITYRLLDFADLTVDGSLATGGAVTVVLIAANWNPLLAILAATAAGAVAGLITALLNTKLKIPPILSGILTMSALYSVNLRILGGKANVSIFGKTTVDTLFARLLNLSVVDDKNLLTIIASGLLVAALIAVMYWFFGTEVGSALRASGNNPKMATAQGVNTDNMKIIGLMLSNGLAALAGSVYAQHNFSADVNMATGTIVIGLASVVIGEVIFSKKLTFWLKLLGVVVGSIIYRLIFTVAVQLGLDTNDLKLVAAVITVIALILPKLKTKWTRKGVAEVKKC